MKIDTMVKRPLLPGRILQLALLLVLLWAPAAISAVTTTVTQQSLQCTTCHGATTVESHHQTSYYLQGECSFCHVGITANGDCSSCHSSLLGLQNVHHDTPAANAGDCAACHTNTADLSQCLSCHIGKTRTRHHEVATTANTPCASCHTTLTPITGCQSCHQENTRNRHHVMAETEGTACVACHPGSTDIVNGCYTCHDFTASNVHHGPAVTPYSLNCTSCHVMAWDRKIRAYVYQPPTIEKCITCHTTVVGSADISDLHHATAPAVAGDCIGCHAGLQPDVPCTSCHATTDGVTIVDRHHNLPVAQLGECTFCHKGAEAEGIVCANCHAAGKTPGPADHHAQPQAVNGDCQYCHTGIQLAGGASCEVCHTVPIPELHHGQPLADRNGDCSACHDSVSDPSVCANCHQANPHHTTSWSQTGDCAHCHFVPPDQTDTPKQAACRECHGQYQHGKGGPIQNYGACKACHLPDPYHAKPTRSPGYTGMPAGKGKFNLFWSLWGGEEGPSENISPNGEDMNDEGGDKWRIPVLKFGMASIEHEGQAYKVPTFDITSGTVNALSVCTSCHADRRALVACDNPKWRNHLTLKRVDVAVYQLAEATYLGSLCAGSGTSPVEICTDSYDNDGDGLIDCNDADCDAATSCQPTPAEICTDGLDNDKDGKIDCNDSDCATAPICVPPAEVCTDGLDNDRDGATDCSDSDCAAEFSCVNLGNLALNKTATASRSESDYPAANAVDGKLDTRWWARTTSGATLTVNLGTTYQVNRVVVAWDADYARSFEIRTSWDGRSYTRVKSVTGATGGTLEYTFTARSARYVQVNCLSPQDSGGYSIKELKVYKP